MIHLPAVARHLLVEARRASMMKARLRNFGCFLAWLAEQWCFVK